MVTRDEWLEKHASPHYVDSKVFLKGIPEDQRDKVIEKLAFTFPTWFFECYTDMEGKPLILEPYQVRYLLDESMFKITLKTRQAGGSVNIAMAKFYKAYTNKSYRCDIVSINLKEAADKIKKIRAFWETLPKKYQIPLEKDNALSIGFHKGKSLTSEINSMAASAGIRGGRKDIVFDEFGHIVKVDELYMASLPAIMNGDLGIDIVSTPSGKKHLFGEIWLNEPDDSGKTNYDMFSRHKFIWCDVQRFVKKGKFEECQYVWYDVMHQNMDRMPELLEEYGNDKIKLIARQLPFDYFLQEYAGFFVDDTYALFPYDLLDRQFKPPIGRLEDQEEEDALEPWPESRPENNDNFVTMGADFAKSGERNDKTVIHIVEKDYDGRLKQRYSKTYNKKEFPEMTDQARDIAMIARQFKVNKIMADAGNAGQVMVPMLQESLPDIQVTGIDFNAKNKNEMVMTFKKLLEQDRLWLMQDDKQLYAETHGMVAEQLPSGNIRYHGEPHDDSFWAMALAVKEGTYMHFAMYTPDQLRRAYDAGITL